MTTYYTSYSSGNDTNSGCIYHPWKTSVYTLAHICAGDEVCFKCGDIWAEQLTPSIDHTAYKSYGNGAKPKFLGVGVRCAYITGRKYISVEGLEFDGASLAYDVIKVDRASTNIIINNCDIHDTRGVTSAANGIMMNADCSYLTVSNCNIYNNGTSKFNQGIYCAASHCLITKNDVHHNFGYGIQLYNAEAGADYNTISYNKFHDQQVRGGITMYGIGNKAYGNLIYDNLASGGIGIVNAIDDEVYNNTIVNNGYGIQMRNISKGLIYRNNIFYANVINVDNVGSIGTVADHNLIGVDPKFTDQSKHIYTLQSDSPAINAGMNVGLIQDFSGTVMGNPPEIGAYEY